MITVSADKQVLVGESNGNRKTSKRKSAGLLSGSEAKADYQPVEKINGNLTENLSEDSRRGKRRPGNTKLKYEYIERRNTAWKKQKCLLKEMEVDRGVVSNLQDMMTTCLHIQFFLLDWNLIVQFQRSTSTTNVGEVIHQWANCNLSPRPQVACRILQYKANKDTWLSIRAQEQCARKCAEWGVYKTSMFLSPLLLRTSIKMGITSYMVQ